MIKSCGLLNALNWMLPVMQLFVVQETTKKYLSRFSAVSLLSAAKLFEKIKIGYLGKYRNDLVFRESIAISVELFFGDPSGLRRADCLL